jgi:hypothetical protein
MTYAKGRTYIPKREREVKQLLKKKDIEGLLWLILEDSYGYGDEPIPPKELKTFAIQQLTLMKSRQKMKVDDVGGEDALSKWLGIEEEKEEEVVEEEVEDGDK